VKRRNSDDELRRLERAAADGSPDALTAYVVGLVRVGRVVEATEVYDALSEAVHNQVNFDPLDRQTRFGVIRGFVERGLNDRATQVALQGIEGDGHAYDVDDPALFAALIRGWLTITDNANDATIYTQDMWIRRGEEHGKDAPVTLTSEGGFYRLMNNPEPQDYGDYEQFDTLVKALGWTWGQGFHWSWHFYMNHHASTSNPGKQRRRPAVTRRKNLQGRPADVLERVIAVDGFGAAEAMAMAAVVDGDAVATVGPNGIVAEDYVHQLIAGKRSFDAIVDGAVFYDPVLDELYGVEPEASGARLYKGYLNAVEVLAKSDVQREREVLCPAMLWVSEAYDRKMDRLSLWSIGLVIEGARAVFERNGLANIEWSVTTAAEPGAIWDALGSMWLSQPWGNGVNPIEQGRRV